MKALRGKFGNKAAPFKVFFSQNFLWLFSGYIICAIRLKVCEKCTEASIFHLLLFFLFFSLLRNCLYDSCCQRLVPHDFLYRMIHSSGCYRKVNTTDKNIFFQNRFFRSFQDHWRFSFHTTMYSSFLLHRVAGKKKKKTSSDK